MVTRIHDVYRLAPGTDPEEFTLRLAAVLGPIQDRLDAKELAELTVFGLDRSDYRGRGRPSSPIRHFAHEQAVAQPDLLDRCAAVFVTDPGSGRVLAVLSVDHDDYLDVFGGLEGVEGFSYWDDEPRPELVSAEEWEDRRSTWDRVFPRTGTAPTGYRWDLREDGGTEMLELATAADADPSMLLDHAPTIERRVDRISADIYGSWLTENTAETDALLIRLRAARANRGPLDRRLEELIAPATAELLRDGVGAHRLGELTPDIDAICRRIHDVGDHDTWLEREGF